MTPEAINALAGELLEEYRWHALRLERAIHDCIKDGEQAARLIDSMSAQLESAGGFAL